MSIIFSSSKEVKPQEILKLRKACGSEDEQEEMWRQAITLSLCVVTARDSGTKNELIGVGFVVGNNRHAQLVDLTVHPDYRQHGIGAKLFDMRVKYCRDKEILYVGNTFDPKQPWLKEFYEKHGFVQIDFAMWLEDSIKRVKNDKSAEF